MAGIVEENSQGRAVVTGHAADQQGIIRRGVWIEPAGELLRVLVPEIAMPGEVALARTPGDPGRSKVGTRFLDGIGHRMDQMVEIGLDQLAPGEIDERAIEPGAGMRMRGGEQQIRFRHTGGFEERRSHGAFVGRGNDAIVERHQHQRIAIALDRRHHRRRGEQRPVDTAPLVFMAAPHQRA